MHTLNVNISLPQSRTISERAAKLMHLFGLRLERLKNERLHHSCRITLKPGQICFIAGSSGAGKSVLLGALYEQVPSKNRIRLEEIPLEHHGSLIDCVDGPLWNATETLSKAGLSDVFSMLNCPSKLSAGQQWRYRLAKALMSDKQWIFIDEFTTSLDRITACVIAHNLRKLATETKKNLILASCHEDMLSDLQPDVIVMKYLNGKTQIIYKDKSQGENQRVISHQ